MDLKAGDVCLIVGGRCPENIGKAVTLYELIAKDDQIVYKGEVCTATAEAAWIVEGDNLVRRRRQQSIFLDGSYGPIEITKVFGHFAIIPPQFLMKISDGDTDIVRQADKEKEHA